MYKKYMEFLASKKTNTPSVGIEPHNTNPMLYDFQRDITNWALRQGRAAIFADCGLGKTPMQLDWARQIQEHTNQNVLIIAPLAVSQQTIREGNKFGVGVSYCRKQDDIVNGVNITNYEMVEHFDPESFGGVVLDESSILKSHTGVYRTMLIEMWANCKYKLACTATPAPNDYTELANHAEFMGIMKRQEMLSMFFVHDGGDTQQWRLKGHARHKFWEWLCSWAVMIRKPSDLGYSDDIFTLPKLNIHEITIPVDLHESAGNFLFRMPAETLQARQKERALTINQRVQRCADLINGDNNPWLIWCNLNAESAALVKLIDGAVEIKGADKRELKESRMLEFSSGDVKILVTKPKIAGFGMNWQHCSNIAFVGLSDSYEQYYQAVRRCWRFGQKKEVHCYIITAETEGAVVANIKRKEQDAERMAKEMVKQMHVLNEQNIKKQTKKKQKYETSISNGDKYEMRLGDCVEEVAALDTDSIHFSIFSPPFADLYTYSDSDRDMGNCANDAEFWQHFKFLIKELYRVIMPGRLVSIHCMNLPTTKTHWGYIGLRDFRGDIIRAFQAEKFIYHSEVCIWKCPVTAVTRTKALGLLHKQLVKDSAMSRMGIPDYLVTMRKPGENPERISGELDKFVGDKETFERRGKMSIDVWQRYASPVWMDINATRTLQKKSARTHKDEKHICPLQLDVIERAIQLWTNEDDIVLSPFAGIGSEGHVALKMGRRFVGIELKESYYQQARKNLANVEREYKSERLFT